MTVLNTLSNPDSIYFYYLIPFALGILINFFKQLLYFINNFNSSNKENLPRPPLLTRKFLKYAIILEVLIFVLFSTVIVILNPMALGWLFPYVLILLLFILATIFLFLGDQSLYYIIKAYKNFKRS